MGCTCLLVAKANIGPGVDFLVDSACEIVPLSKPTDGGLRVLEICSGAYGGWKKGCQFLSNHFGQDFHVLSLDCCFESSWVFAVANNVPLVDSPSLLPLDFPAGFPHLALCADVGSREWLSVADRWGVEIVTISPPCQPFSSAGNSSGLDSPDGVTCAEAVAACKMFRPRIILLEEVCGFASHPHKDLIIKLLRWAGFVVKFARCIDAGDVCPTSRSRFLLMAVRAEDTKVQSCEFQMWLTFAGINPLNYGSIVSADWSSDPRLQITKEIRELASDPEMHPQSKRTKITPGEVFSSRCKPVTCKAPTIMASYGSQHLLPHSALVAKGLLCHFVVEDQALPRRWHPIELVLLHGFVGSHFILADWVTAYRHIGNQICVPHALFMLVQAVNWIPERSTRLDFKEVITKLHDSHITASSMHTVETNVGIFISDSPFPLLPGQQENIEQFWTKVSTGALPKGTYWTLDGFAPLQEDQALAVQDSQIAATVAFPQLLPVEFLERPLTKILVDSLLELDEIESAWNGCFECFSGTDKLVLRIGLFRHSPQQVADVVVVLHQNTVFVVSAMSAALEWVETVMTCPLQDVFGALSAPELKFACLVHDIPPEIAPSLDFTVMSFVCANDKCVITPFAMDDFTSFGFSCHGKAYDVAVVCKFWSCLLPTKLLDATGFRVSFQPVDGGFRLELVASYLTPCVPLRHLCFHVLSAAFRTLLTPLCVGSTQSLRIKIFDRVLWDARSPDAWTLESLMAILHSVSFWVAPCFRVLVFGKQADWRLKLSELRGSQPTLRLGLLLPLRGGGPSTKLSHKTQVTNALAGVLIEEGYDLKWVAQSVDSLTSKVPLKELSKALTASRDSRLQIARQYLKQCEISLPANKPSMTSQAAFLAKKAKSSVTMPNPMHYRVIEGSLINEDGSPTPFLPAFGAQLHGYHCIAPGEAAPWLQGTQALSKDELVLLIFGEVTLGTGRHADCVTVPCVDESGNRVLVSCTMVQFGDRKVKCHSGDGFIVDSQETTLMAMTVEYDDWKDSWSEITRYTFRFFKQQPFLVDNLVTVWGRSFRRGKSATSADDATSVQVHMLIKTSAVVNVLKAAGSASIWATPKTKCGKIDQAWKLIWQEQKIELQSAAVAVAKLPESAGLIKIKGRYAIRVSKDNYKASWTLLFPGVNPPEMLDATMTWKIEALPYGVTCEMLAEWSKHVQWPLKPLRAVGPKSWVVGATAPPPQQHLFFNSAPLLIREITAKQPPMNPIIAGPRPKASAALPPLNGDPWAGNSATNPWANYKGTQPSTAAPPASNPVIGPTEQKFQAQNDRISQLESAIQTLQQDQLDTKGAVKSLHTEIQQRDEQIKTHLDARLSSVKQELDASFSAALQKQSASWESGFM